MIWHIFKKDWNLLWPLVAIVATVQTLNAVMWFTLGHFLEPQSLETIAQIFIIPVLLGIAALIVTAVHQDILPGDRQDWLVRPIRRRDLILAKLLFVLVAIHGPILIVDMAQCVATGFAFRDSLSAALSRNIDLFVSISMPALALATMTSSVVEVIGGGLAIFLTFVVFIFAMDVGNANYVAGAVFARMSAGRLMLELWSAAGLLTAIAVISLQYFRRATLQARGITLCAILVLLPVSAFMPWASAFAFEQWFSPDPNATKAVAIAFDPNLGKLALKPGAARPANSVWLPLRVSGLEPDSIVLKDRADVSIIGRDGTILYRGLTIGDDRTRGSNGEVTSAIDDFSVRTAAGTEVLTHQFITLPRKIYDLVRSQPVRMELDYSLTLFHIKVSDQIPAVNGDKRIIDLGWCKTRIDDDGDEIEMRCLRTGPPIACNTAVLENTVSGVRNQPSNYCADNWLPFDTHFVPTAMRRFGGDLHFRDPQGLAKYPVDSSQIANAQVMEKIYWPVARFTRHLTIPEIRLSDWEADTHETATNATPPQ